MPLPKRNIEPIHVARSVYQQDDHSIELETVTNTTLTNIIRQLSSISKHAEDIFGELARDVGIIGDRANCLQARIDRLSMKVTQLDSAGEDISLTDIQLKKAFKSIKLFDQQIFCRDTMPAPLLETYSECDKPPPLDKLNVYRDDGKDAIKFYTDPNFFFDLWRQEMLKDTERAMHDRGKKTHRPKDGNTSGSSGNANNSVYSTGNRGHKKRVRPPHNTREKQRQFAIGQGEAIMPNNVIYRQVPCDESGYSSMGVYDTRPSRPNSIEIKRQYHGETVDGSGNNMYGTVDNQKIHYVQDNYALESNQNLQQNQLYDEAIYNSQSIYSGYSTNMMTPDGIYGPSTPNKTKIRPSQPPPAPPSNNGTPTVSNGNTPTRARSMSSGRDNLPPPPPVPDCLMQMHNNSNILINGANGSLATKLLGKGNASTRAGSPQMLIKGNFQDANALVLAQLNNQINNMNTTNIQMNQSIHDLPPPPPIPEEISPKLLSPNAAPPPPPPPPPMEVGQTVGVGKIIPNGNLNNQPHGNIISLNSSSHNVGKRVLPPITDTRTDLMKAIRDGIKLKKVEKPEQCDITKRTVPLNDVASILARRVAIELSDSEESDSEDDSEIWMESNETSA